METSIYFKGYSMLGEYIDQYGVQEAITMCKRYIKMQSRKAIKEDAEEREFCEGLQAALNEWK